MDGWDGESSSKLGYERRIVRRSRLLEALDGAEERTALLIAPAGYGKTTLARQWLERAGGAWVTVSLASGDIPVLARDLAAAIADLRPLDIRRVETALRAGRTPIDQARGVARTILAQVSEPVDGWVVIDDYQFVVGNQAAEELVARIERSGRFKLLVTSRERPTWATSRRRVHLETVELGVAELALDDAEVAQLLPPDRRTAALRREARGWPAVIGLAAHSRLSDVALTTEALSGQLYDYFAEELFERAPPDVRRWLTLVAALPALAPGELSEFLGADGAAAQVAATGLAYESDGRIEVHPLARTFLIAKLKERDDAREVGVAAFDLALSKSLYDDAFEVVKALGLDDCLVRLIVSSYPDLVETGRIATLAEFGRESVPQELRDLISADLALNQGAFDRARALAESTASRLAEGHPLKARSYLLAGRAAHLSHGLDDAYQLHSVARQHAATTADVNDSVWGKCLATLYMEDDDRVETTLRELESLAHVRPTDRVRLDFARSHYALFEGRGGLGGGDPDVARLAPTITDPWVRTSWSYTRGHSLVLQARYEDAAQILRAAHSDLEEFGLSFGLRHVEWSLAAAELGLRHFARSENRLRRVERDLGRRWDLHTQLNVQVLRARLCLAQQRMVEAVEITADDFSEIPSRAMYAEYLATRAMALAVVGRASSAFENASRAAELTRSGDSRVLCAAVHVILAFDAQSGAHDAAESLLATASRLGIWDGVVCVMRARPALVSLLAMNPRYRSELREVLLRSKDLALAKSAGLVTRSTGTRGALSPREREIMDHVVQGRRNADIGKSLFITVATVKRHLDNAYRKLGARNRSEAIARYAEIEIEEMSDA